MPNWTRKHIRIRPLPISLLLYLAISAGAAYGADRSGEEKVTLHGVLAELHDANTASSKRAATFAERRGLRLDGERVFVTVEASTRNGAHLIDFSALAADGIEVVSRSRSFASAWVPVEKLPLLSAAEGVGLVRPPLVASQLLTSQGVAKTGAADFHTAGYDGSGQKVAIIDLGFTGLATAVTTSEVSYVYAHDFTGGGLITTTPHGTGVAEVVYDMAPGAELYLMKVSNATDLEQALDTCIAYGVDVINHSVGWFGLPGDGTGTICGIADDAHTAGILWVNSAGNHAKQHTEATFNDTDADSFHNFTPADKYVPLSVTSGGDIYLFLNWDAAWPSTEDYDLHLYNSSYTEVAAAVLRGNQYPSEYILYTATYTGTYYAAVKKYAATSDHHIDLMSMNHEMTNYGVKGGSLLSPADGYDVLTVGALYQGSWSTGPIESFSSQGPTNDGRTKPDVTGPDGVSNLSYGSFYGTSASSPHVAGAAALLLDAHPTWTADSVSASLKATAIDMGSAGLDTVYGYGRIDLDTSGGGGGGGTIDPVTSFSATADHGKVDLAWTNPSDTLFESTTIRYSTSSYPASEASGSAVGIFPDSPGSSDSHEHTGLTNGTTYYYSAFAYDGIDYSSAATASGTPQDTTPPLPDPVTAFTASARDTAVYLSWTNPADAGFESTTIRYSTSGFPGNAAEGTAVENGAGGVFAEAPGTTDSFLHPGLTNGHTYYYSAFAYDGSDYSSRTMASATPADTASPAQVSNFTAVAGEGEVKLSWNNPSDGDFVKSEIRYSTSSYPVGTGAGARLAFFANSPGSTDSTTHSGLVNGTTYYYSAFSYDAIPNTSDPRMAEATPLDVTATAPVSSFQAAGDDGEVHLSWSNPADADFSFTRIRWSTGSYPSGPAAGNDLGDFSASPGSGDSTTHSGLSNGVTYYYAAYAFDGDNNDANCAQASAVPADTTSPDVVTLFTATPGDTVITLAWTNPSNSDFSFTRIRWSTVTWPAAPESAHSLGDFSDTPGSSVSAVHSGLSNNTTYYYAAFAADGDANFASADSASATPADTTVPSPVSDFTATKGDGEVNLTWTNPGDADFERSVIRYSTATWPTAPDSGLPVDTFTELAGESVAYVHRGLTNSTGYYYAAFAMDDENNFSSAALAVATPADTTAPAAPAGLTATGLDGAVDLSWTNPSDSDFSHSVIRWSYDSYPATPDSGALLTSSVTGAGSAETYLHTGVKNSSTAYYSAFSYDSTGNFSSMENAEATAHDSTAPADVIGLAAAAGDSSVSLSWTNPGDTDFDRTLIRWSTSAYPAGPADGALLAEVAGNPGSLESYEQTGLANGTTFYYAAFAADADTNFATGVTASATPADTVSPGSVDSLEAAAGIESVTLSWINPEDTDLEGVLVRFSTDSIPSSPSDGSPLPNGQGGIFSDSALSEITFAHTSLSAGTTCYYGLFSFDEVPNFSSAATASAVPLQMPTIIDTTGPAPLALFTAEPGEGEVLVKWINPGDVDLAGIEIRFSTAGFPLLPGDGDDLPGGSKGAYQALPGAADSVMHRGLMNDTLYYYSAFVYDTLDNYSTALKDSARPADKTAPVLTLGLFQNPLLTRHVDLYLIGSEPLDSSTLSLTTGPLTLDASLNDPAEEVWTAPLELPGAGTFIIAAGGADHSGNRTDISSSLSVSIAHAGASALAVSPDGNFRATFPADGFDRDTWVLVIPGDTPSSDRLSKRIDTGTGVEAIGTGSNRYVLSPPRRFTSGEGVQIEWHFDDTAVDLFAPDEIGLLHDDGTTVKCFVDVRGGVLYATVDRTGGYRLSRSNGRSTTLIDPVHLLLGGNRPNPFNPTTVIPFEIGAAGPVTLSIHALSGRLVRILIRDTLTPGYHSALWDGRDSRGRELGSGFYLYRLDTMAGSESRKMLLVR